MVSDEFRRYFNDWLFEFFGGRYEKFVKDYEIIRCDGSLIMNQKTFDLCKNSLKSEKIK